MLSHIFKVNIHDNKKYKTLNVGGKQLENMSSVGAGFEISSTLVVVLAEWHGPFLGSFSVLLDR